MAYQEQQAKLQIERQLQLRQQEEAAKKNVTDTLKQQRQKLRQKEVAILHTDVFKLNVFVCWINIIIGSLPAFLHNQKS